MLNPRGGGYLAYERGGDKTPSYLAVKVSFRVAREKKEIYIYIYCLCFNMVSFRGQKKLGPLPDRSPLGVEFKISDEHPHPFHMRSPPPPG